MAPLSVAEALQRVTEGLGPTETEQVPLERTAGRTLAADLASRLTQPPFDASAMDGYAVRAADLAKLPVALAVVGESAAGRGFTGAVGPGQAVRIFTGAPIPTGADHIVIQEATEANGEHVVIREASDLAAFIRPRGFDFTERDVLLEQGRRLGPRELSLAAAMNHAELPVRRRPRVAILATGDELVRPGEDPGRDQIVSSIPIGLAAMIEAAGGEPIRLGIVPDRLDRIEASIEQAAGADILVTIGGASVGDHDLVRPALKQAGFELTFWSIAMRPGKPLLFGRRGNLRVIGLPGNPVSSLICCQVFILPMIERLLGRAPGDDRQRTAVLAGEVEENGAREHYMRAELVAVAEGPPRVRPLGSQDSSLLSTLARADCLIVRPPHAPKAAPGETVRVLALA